jgi:hypothetical protein
MTSARRPSLEELAAGQLDDVDARALDQVAQLYSTLDPVPPGLVDRIAFGITLDALHAELAELQRNSDLVGARSEEVTSAQSVTFTSSTMSTMVTITALSTDRARLDGWIAPGAGVGIELRLVGETRSVTADEDGRFVFDDVPRGLAQFVLRPPSGSGTVVTPSIEL